MNQIFTFYFLTLEKATCLLTKSFLLPGNRVFTRWFFLLASGLLVPVATFAQSPLVAFTGVTRTSSPDGFSFVAVQDIPAGTSLYFTDEEYYDVCNAFAFDNTCTGQGEPYLVYMPPASGLTSGDVVFVSETSSNNFTLTGGGGTITLMGSGGFSLTSSDALMAFTTSNPADPQNNVLEIYAVLKLGGPFAGTIPSGDSPAADYPNAVITILPVAADDAEYNPAIRNVEVSGADFEDVSNWNIENPAANLALSTVNFTGGFNFGILPVELITFSGSQEGKHINLFWETASESNNDRFEIEESKNSREFQKIGEVIGSGTTVEQQIYSFEVKNPRKGISYYRLKQIDFDGRFEYSKVISAHFNGENGEIGEFYPNPSKLGIVNLDYTSQTDEKISIVVFDMTGKLVVNEIQQISNGDNNLSFDFSELNTGIYIVKIGDERNPIHRKLILER